MSLNEIFDDDDDDEEALGPKKENIKKHLGKIGKVNFNVNLKELALQDAFLLNGRLIYLLR